MSDPEERGDDVPRGNIRTIQWIVAALLLVGLVTAIFVIQNTRSTRIDFLVWSGSFPVAGALLLAAVLGGMLGFLVAYLRQRQIAKAYRRHRRGEDERRRESGERPTERPERRRERPERPS